jgi:hypothetical protein
MQQQWFPHFSWRDTDVSSKLAYAVIPAALLLACNSNQTPVAHGYGAASVALATTGSDGNRYRLPAESVVEFDAANFSFQQTLNGEDTSLSVSLPIGTYNANLFSPAADGSWTLDEVDSTGNVIGSVAATLSTQLPLSVTITSGGSTPVAFAFNIASGGSVSFDNGTAAVSITVTNNPATNYSFALDTQLTVASGDEDPSLTGLPGVGDTLSFSTAATLSGPWQETGGSSLDGVEIHYACAPLKNITKSGTAVSPATNTGFSDLVAEVGKDDINSSLGGAVLCIVDDGTNNYVRVRLSTTGAPTTPTFAGLGTAPLFFRVQASAQLPQRIYDAAAHTLDLSTLTNSAGLSGAPIYRGLSNAFVQSDDFGTLYYHASFTGTLNFSLSGT